MRQQKYSDGTPSREIDNDCEDIWQESTERFFCKTNQKVILVDVRDRLTNIKDLVSVCQAALLNNEGLDQTSVEVAHVLHFFVKEELETVDKELTEWKK